MWTDEQAEAAIAEGVAADAAADGDQAPAAPSPVTPEGETPAPVVQPEAAPAAPDTFDGGKFNPDTLAPELQPAWKQLQAAYTEKTQGLAEQRKQFESLGSVEELQQAVELRQRISDPANWQQLHAELADAMQQHGLTPAQASAEASRQMGEAAAEAPAMPALPSEDDPELGPLAQNLKALQARIDTFERSQVAQRQAAEQERIQLAVLGELQRQEILVKEAHPTWDQTKIDAVYDLSGSLGGNLVQAADRLEQLLAADRESYVSQKIAAQQASDTAPVLGANSDSTKPTRPTTLAEAEALGLADLAALAAADA